MSLWESGDSSGQVSLAVLFEGESARGRSEQTIPDYATLITRGGWPEIISTSALDPERYVRNYLIYAVEHAIPTAVGTRHEPTRLHR